MRGETENRAEKYIRNHKNRKKWLAFVLCLSLFTGTATLYGLNKPATAMTQEGAGQVGLVMETADNEFEQGLIEQMESEEEETSDSSENIEEGQDSDTEDENVLIEEKTGDEKEGENLEEDQESETVESAEESASTENSDKASTSDSSDSESGVSSNASSSSTLEESAGDASSAASSGASAAGEASTTGESEEDIEYVNEYSIKATLVDEFGEEIDSENYTEIDLPEFDSELLLDDPENPPYDDVKVKTGLFRTAVYSYVEATVNNKIIKGLKKETVEGYVKNSESEEASDSAASLSMTDEESEDELTSVTVYSYTTNGENYTAFEEDTVINFVYSLGTQTEFEYEDVNSGLKITAKLQIPGAIPDDAQLVVTQITSDTNGYNYDAYMNALNDNAKSIADDAGLEDANTYTDNNTLMYDIAFMYEGEEIQPAEGAVSISIEFTNNQLTNELAVSSEEDITVVHLPIKAEVKEQSEITSTVEATEISSEDIEVKTLTDATAEVSSSEKIEFSEDNFSVFAITMNNNAVTAASAAFVREFDYVTSFGDAFDYGVVANKYLWSGDTESNVMVGSYYSSANDVGASANFSNAGGDNYFGSVSGISLIRFHLTPADIYLGSEAYQQYSNGYFKFENVDGTNIAEDTETDVASTIEGIDSYYEKYENLGSSFEALFRDYGGTTIDLRDYDEGTYVLTYTGDDIHIDDEKLSIYLNENQHLILNCTSSSLTIHKYLLNGEESSSYVGTTDASLDWLTTAVIFNVINAENVYISETCGTFIAPDSNVSVNGASAGVLVANSVTAGCEWHYHNHGLPSVYGDSIYLKAVKTVNNDIPLAEEIFTFDIYEWDSSSSKWGTTPILSAQNTLGNVDFNSINYSSASDIGTHYYKIVEKIGNDEEYTYDSTVYVVKVEVSSSSRLVSNKYYTTYSASEPEYFILSSADANPAFDVNLTAITGEVPEFNNKSYKVGYLRIHKMVVNDFGSYIVRDSKDDAILSNVEFTIENKESGAIIWFKGFTAKLNTSDAIGTAYEYVNGSRTGVEYTVHYNDNAQWTIEGIPVGDYIVKEVADKYTFSYNPLVNASSPVPSIYSRVTKYAVTIDKNGGKQYGVGGDNYRKTFSVDVSSIATLYDEGVGMDGTEDVTVTTDYDETPTVQIANYYSNPMAPIMVKKNLVGGTWTSDMSFTFEIESYGVPQGTKLSDGTAVEVASSPLPENTTVTITGDGENTSQNVFLGEINYLYEGTYYYKVTETPGDMEGVKYDSTVYYVKVEVSKYHTTFYAKYRYSKQANYSYDYDGSGIVDRNDEDFYYLGADVTYYKNDPSMTDSNAIVQTAQVRLKTDPDTSGTTYYGDYIISYSNDYNAVFVNSVTGKLTVTKNWLNANGQDDSSNHSILNLEIWQKTENSTEWNVYGTITLTKDNWSKTVDGLPVADSNGNKYIYSVKESDDYLATHIVTYSYEIDVNAASQEIITVNGEQCKNTGYSMTSNLGDEGYDFGNVTITNQSAYTNVLPSTGGYGTIPYSIAGILLATIATLGVLLTGKKSKCEF